MKVPVRPMPARQPMNSGVSGCTCRAARISARPSTSWDGVGAWKSAIPMRICAWAALAEKLFRQALVLQPWDLSIESLIGEALSAQKKFPAAADCFVRVLRSRPNDLRSLLALARLRRKEGHLEAAEAALRDAVKGHPGSAEAALELDNCLKFQEAQALAPGR